MQNTDTADRLLTIRECAQALRLSERTVRAATSARTIRFVRLRSRANRGVVRVRQSDLDAFIARGVVEPADG